MSSEKPDLLKSVRGSESTGSLKHEKPFLKKQDIPEMCKMDLKEDGK